MKNSLLANSRLWHRRIGSLLFAFFALVSLTGLMLGWKSLFTTTVYSAAATPAPAAPATSSAATFAAAVPAPATTHTSSSSAAAHIVTLSATAPAVTPTTPAVTPAASANAHVPATAAHAVTPTAPAAASATATSPAPAPDASAARAPHHPHAASRWLPLDSLQVLAAQTLTLRTGAPANHPGKAEARVAAGYVEFQFKPDYYVRVEGTTGAVTLIQHRYGGWIQDIHDGAIVDSWIKDKGEIGKKLYSSVLALALLFLTLSGFYLWYRPLQIKKARHAAVTQPAVGKATQLTAGNVTQPATGNVTQPATGNVTQPTAGNVTQTAAGNVTQPATGKARATS